MDVSERLCVHLFVLLISLKAVSEGLCGVFWPGVQESGDDLTRSNRAVSSGAAAGAKTCWSGTEDPAGLKATTGDDVAKSLQVYHGICRHSPIVLVSLLDSLSGQRGPVCVQQKLKDAANVSPCWNTPSSLTLCLWVS